MTTDPRLRARDAFVRRFGGEPVFFALAPGRVNLIGEHTDYNEGYVLPCAISKETVIAARGRRDDRVMIVAADFDDAQDEFTIADIAAKLDASWENYIRGVAWALCDAKKGIGGIEMAIAGNIPQASGLSSSASLENAAGLAFTQAAGQSINPTELALLSQRAENDFVGCQCGVMDQLVSAQGKDAKAILMDCRTLDCRPIPIADDWSILIIHSGVRRGLVDGAYNERREQCEMAARSMGVKALRDADLDQLERARVEMADLSYLRARHVISENARVLQAVDALIAGDLQMLGALMAASHASMRDDFDITTPEIDRLVQIVQAAIGSQGGARMTGGGFGGCVVAVCQRDAVDEISAHVRKHYRTPAGEPPLILDERPGAGASVERA